MKQKERRRDKMRVMLLFTAKNLYYQQHNDILRNKTTRKYNIVEKERLEQVEICLKMEKQWAILLVNTQIA